MFKFKRLAKSLVSCGLGVITVASLSFESNAANYAWPANFEGVMLQGFYWDSYNGTNNTKWTTLTANAEELSKYFKVIWVPNAAKCASSPSNGYDPVYWFSNYNSSFGNESQLRTMISTFKKLGTDIIEDVVINHRSGVSNWTNFPKETWNGKTYQLGPEHICCTDEVKNATGQAKPTGAPDTGEDFNGARDLDHTNATVQENCKAYCSFLLQEMGFAGFRLDMVKGYAGKYTKMYNEASKPKYCVGEYWDGNYDTVAYWIESTGRQSAAFDFPCKYQINKAFSNNDMTELVWKANGTTDQPAGLIHFGYPQYAVTFIDNHDTCRDDWNKFNGNLEAAYAFILSSPGTPCVFYKHYVEKKSAIQKLIAARNSVGLHNQSAVKVLKSTRDCYMAEVTGKRGTLVVKVGSSMDAPSGYSNSNIVATGNGYCVWTKTTGGSGDDPVIPDNPGTPFKVYFNNSAAKWATPTIHYWGGEESTWPGVKMTPVAGADNVWEYTVPAGTTGILFNAGDGDATKTQDFVAVANHIYTQAGDQGEYKGGSTPVIPDNPGSAFKVYFNNSSAKWATPTIHYWGAEESTWPGVKMSAVAGDKDVWVYTVPAGTTGLLFNAGDGDATKTQDFVAVANHIYTQAGDQGEYKGNGGGGDDPVPNTYPANLYLIGNLNDMVWASAHAIPQMRKNGAIYEWDSINFNDAGEGYAYFSFLTQLDAEDGEWTLANDADRYGASTDNEEINPGTPATIVKYPVNVNAMGAYAWKISSGIYNVSVNLATSKLTISKTTDLIELIETSDSNAIYFNLQGQRVINPEKGIYIKVVGNKSQKVIL